MVAAVQGSGAMDKGWARKEGAKRGREKRARKEGAKRGREKTEKGGVRERGSERTGE